nr:ubiquitin carboxyl-terminal hydrolase 12-like [Tanacetum cinerariifolium]
MIYLNGCNYTLWKRKMEDLLYVNRLHQPVFCSEKPERQKEEEWNFLHRQVCAYIRQWVDENVLNHVSEEVNARTLWNKLEQLYAQKTCNYKLFLIKQLMGLRYRDGTAMSDHLIAFQGIIKDLLEIGIKFNEEVQGLWFLGSLPNSWESFRTSLLNLALDGVISLELVRNRVLNEEMKRKLKDEEMKDDAEHLRIRLKKEQEEKEQRRKEKAEAQLYTMIKVARDENLHEQIGKHIYFDLVDHEKVRSFHIPKQTSFARFKEEVAKELGIPVQYQRFWLWAKRANCTYRPDRPLTPLEEAQPVSYLAKVSDRINNELKLFLEVELGQDSQKEEILLFFKLFDPIKEELRYVGRLFVKGTEKPTEILAKLNELAGFAPDEDIELFEEFRFKTKVMCEHVDKNTTFQASQLQNGDIICLQKPLQAGNVECRYSDVPSFFEYVHNRQPEEEEMLVPHSEFAATEGPQPIEVAPAEAANTVDAPVVADPPSAMFMWTIENFSRLTGKKLYSDVFVVGGYKWRVLIFPKGNNVDHLSMYLDVADSTELPYGWSRYAQFSLAVVNQIHSKFTMRKDTKHQFNARETDWGFTSFMPLSELYDPSKGYLLNDTSPTASRENERLILNSVQNGPLVWPTIAQEDGTTMTKKYEELSVAEKLQANCDLKATNIVLQGLPPDVYAIVNHYKFAKEIWDRVKLLMQGTKLSLQEIECKLYDEFDKFSFVKGETLYQYYWRFAQLINNMNVINMSMRPVQVNTKFLNSLPPEWSKFVTDVKLARDFHTTNYDQLYSYLEQHEAHANKTRLMRERYEDPLAFLLQGFLQPTINLELPLIREAMPLFKTAGLLCNKFKEGKDKVMLVLETRITLLVSRKTMQEDMQGLLNAIIGKEKLLLAQAQESGHVLDEEKLAFLADPGIPDGQAAQTTIPNNVAFQTEDVDAYDSDCDDVSTAQAVLMANISNYGSDVILEVPHSKTYHNDMDNQSVHTMQHFEQTPVVDFSDNEITSDSNIIPYSQYLQETQQEAVQDTNLYAQQDSMILSVIKQMSEQMINHVNNWKMANQEKNNESLTAELERYKECVKTFEQRLNIDLSTREKMIDSQMDDMIKEKLALKQQFDSLEQNLSNQIKEKEYLLQTFTVFKNESKKRKKAQRIKSTLYDGSVISSQHVVIPVIDDKETLILEEDLLDEITEVQTVFNQIEAAVQQCLVDKQCFEIHNKELFLDNDRLLHQIMSHDVLLTVMNSTAIFGDFMNLEMQRSETCNKCLDLEAELVKKGNMVERDVYAELSNRLARLEKHCICLELNIQLNQQNFQTDKSCENQNATEFLEYFENIDLKAQLQEKDTTINKLRNHIKSLRESDKKDKVKQDMDEIETINIKLEHRMFKLDLDPLALRLLKNRDAHIYYLKYNQEQANILQGIVEQAKAKQPLDTALEFSCPSKKYKIVESKIVESRIGNNSKPNHSWGSSATDVPSSSSLVNDRFRFDQIAKIMGYGDYQLGNVTISRVYYVEGLRHNLFSVGQFCDLDLEVAFWKNTCFIRNIDGVDLLLGSRDTKLYTIFFDDMLKTSLICLLSKASNTKSWLWHRRLSHLNFGTLNKLAKDGLTRGIPKLKFKKDHLCSPCVLRKSKKSSHQPKGKDTNQEKLYLLHMDLCGPMHMESINAKKYILVMMITLALRGSNFRDQRMKLLTLSSNASKIFKFV